MITPSNFAAAPLVARYNIPRERLTIIPRSIDTAAFDPAVVDAARIETLRNAWRVPQAARILLAPGRVAPWNGQLILPDVARIMLDSGLHGFVFVLAGERRRHRKYAEAVVERAQAMLTGAVGRVPGKGLVVRDGADADDVAAAALAHCGQ